MNATKYRRIRICESAKEVWNILKITHERTTSIKVSKIQKLKKDFKNLTIEDVESFDDFYDKLNNDSKVVKKNFRSLLEGFQPKITIIEESKEVGTQKSDEFVRNI